MKKTIRWILISLAVLVILGTTCAVASGLVTHNAVKDMEKKHLHDILAIRERLDDVEDRGTSVTITVKDYDDDSDGHGECTCTVGHHNAPESEGVADETIPSYESPEPLYTVKAHDGIIGIFDSDGTLCRSVNVFIMTLPEADREALAAGIPAYSEEEMQMIADRFA